MKSRIIVKNLPKKITEEKFKVHFSKIGQLTDSKLKYSKDGKFRQFGFIGYKTEEEAVKAIEYFNNTFIDASRIVVELCKPLNDTEIKPWSKYSVKTPDKKKPNQDNLKTENNEEKKDKKTAKLDKLLGSLKDDEGFSEFLAANSVIKDSKNIWKNDVNLNNNTDQNETEKSKEKKPKKKEKKAEPEPKEEPVETTKEKVKENTEEVADLDNGRLFIRNLSYQSTEEDLEKLFKDYAPLVEVSMPIDTFSKKPKGFAYITFMFPEKAVKALNDLDGSIFQGRMLHIIPAKMKAETEDGAKETFKSKKEKELKKKSQSSYNWNSLFINNDAVATLMASKYNVNKSDIYDVHTSGKKSNSSIAVKLALGETQIVNDMKKFLNRNGVRLDSFENGNLERSKTTILIKNLPINTQESELKEFFEKSSIKTQPKRLVLPEYGVAALIEYSTRQEARDVFKKLAYRKFKSVPLYLEWAPVDIFYDDDSEEMKEIKKEVSNENKINEEAKNLEEKKNEKQQQKAEEKEDDDDDEADYEDNATLFVKNLNFDTTDQILKNLFSNIGKCKASIARKIAPNKESLSMGYGFVKFKKASDALEAIKRYQDYNLEGHNLELKFSNRHNDNKGDANANRKKSMFAKKDPLTKSSKILVRNIPFEAKTKEIQELFTVFGELKYVRLPKKIDGSHRGFGFVDFVTISDAERAFKALSQSTHLFGRRLVLEWAEPEQSQDVEILRSKEEILASTGSKKLKRSSILEDLDRDNEAMAS